MFGIHPAEHIARVLQQRMLEAAAGAQKGHAVFPGEADGLQGAAQAEPRLPRGLLLDSLCSGWLETALRLGCVAVVAKHTLWDSASVSQAKSAGLRLLSYTVNDELVAQRLLGLGLDGIITDQVDAFSPLL